jgi:putative copper resistance protein D
MTATSTTTRVHYPLALGLLAAGIFGVLAALGITATDPPPGIEQPGLVVEAGLPLVRLLLDLAAVSTVGLSLLPKLIGFNRPQLAEPVLDIARRAAVLSAAVWAGTALTALVLYAADLRPGATLTIADVWNYVRQFGAGQGLLIVAGCALLYVLVGLLAVRSGERVPAELRITLAMFTLLPLPVTGHAANTSVNLHDISMVSMELHVLTAVTWCGGLGAVVVLLATRRTLLAETLPRFSKLAGLCLVIVGLTGLFNAWFEMYLTPGVHWYTAIFTTSYGRLALVKLLCFAALAVIGAQVRFRLLPRIVRQDRTALLSWVGLELAVFGLAFGFAVVLTRVPVA